MRELKKILEEMAVDEGYLEDWYINSVDDTDPVWTNKHIEELVGDFVVIPKTEVCKHMDDGWIPVEERLPKVAGDIDDDNCPEFNVTIDGADKATTLKCSSDGTFFDDNGYVYPVIAWRPLPEPYRPERSDNHDEQ